LVEGFATQGSDRPAMIGGQDEAVSVVTHFFSSDCLSHPTRTTRKADMFSTAAVGNLLGQQSEVVVPLDLRSGFTIMLRGELRSQCVAERGFSRVRILKL
jgi:hypothetical protein